jgi:flagella basal body P-ring formation protein FlgA
MFFKVLILLLSFSSVFATTLEKFYYVNSDHVKLLEIMPDAQYDVTLYKIEKGRYTKKVKSKDLIKLLNSHGFKDIDSKSNYIKFIRKSPIDTSKIKNDLKKIYLEKYPDIDIKTIKIIPRGYIKSLPSSYITHVAKKAHLSRKGILNIKLPRGKKLFFDFYIDADIYVFTTAKKVIKGDLLSNVNTKRRKITFDKFRAIPVGMKQINTTQFRHNIKEDEIITFRDISTLQLVKKGSTVSAVIQNNNLNISFSAKAIRNGRLNDIITIEKQNGQRLQARVIGRNRVEIK